MEPTIRNYVITRCGCDLNKVHPAESETRSCQSSHGASVALRDCETECVGVARYPGSFAKQLDSRLMSAEDYAYIFVYKLNLGGSLDNLKAISYTIV